MQILRDATHQSFIRCSSIVHVILFCHRFWPNFKEEAFKLNNWAYALLFAYSHPLLLMSFASPSRHHRIFSIAPFLLPLISFLHSPQRTSVPAGCTTWPSSLLTICVMAKKATLPVLPSLCLVTVRWAHERTSHRASTTLTSALGKVACVCRLLKLFHAENGTEAAVCSCYRKHALIFD